jgi:alkylresorcinol/alkylpyrone synthase
VGEQRFNVDRLEDLHRAVGVRGRHLALPIAEYPDLVSFRARNDAWTKAAVDLGERAVKDATAAAGLDLKDLSHIFFVTVTGLATPSIDARLCNRLGLKSDIRRTPIFGLGCVAGAAGIARMSDWLRGFPGSHAVLLAVELCSLTLQREDLSIANIIASGLFGDGGAAMVMSGDETGPHAGPRVVAATSSFYPNTERVMGWDFVDTGFRSCSAKSPGREAHVRERRRLPEVGTEPARHHPLDRPRSGPVLKAFEEALDFRPRRSSARGTACATSATSRAHRCSSCSASCSRAAPRSRATTDC